MFWFLKCHALLVLFMLSRYGNCKVFKRVRNKVVRFFSMVKYMYNNCDRSAKYKWNSNCDYRGTSYKKEMQGWIGKRTHIFGANGKFISISADKKYRKKKTNNSLPGNTAGKEIILEGNIYFWKMCRRQVQTRSKKLFMMEWITKQWPYVPIDSDESWQCRIIDKSYIH